MKNGKKYGKDIKEIFEYSQYIHIYHYAAINSNICALSYRDRHSSEIEIWKYF